ncbi:hypothetical protein ACFYRN_42930 [Streptomyces sp. NPDC005227]|uniref:hypothetical protein n=1 Tax=unclassified Streptomyces TaxID=2593676 RepID=UPI003691D8DC
MDVERPHATIELPEGSWWDWEVLAWDSGQFRFTADDDLRYHHGLELAFTAPLFISCPATFHDPVFRAPTPEELLRSSSSLVERRRCLLPSERTAAQANSSESRPARRCRRKSRKVGSTTAW